MWQTDGTYLIKFNKALRFGRHLYLDGNLKQNYAPQEGERGEHEAAEKEEEEGEGGGRRRRGIERGQGVFGKGRQRV